MPPRVKKLSSAKLGVAASMLTGHIPGSFVEFWASLRAFAIRAMAS